MQAECAVVLLAAAGQPPTAVHLVDPALCPRGVATLPFVGSAMKASSQIQAVPLVSLKLVHVALEGRLVGPAPQVPTPPVAALRPVNHVLGPPHHLLKLAVSLSAVSALLLLSVCFSFQ
jgi:hypothetical protein